MRSYAHSLHKIKVNFFLEEALGHFKNKDFKELIKTTDEAFTLTLTKEQKILFLNYKAGAYYYLRDYQQALSICNQCLITITAPYLFALFTNKAKTLWQLKRYDEVLECYDRLLKEKSLWPTQQAVIYARKGFVLNHLKNYEAAFTAYNQSLKLNPRNQKVLHKLNLVAELFNSQGLIKPTIG